MAESRSETLCVEWHGGGRFDIHMRGHSVRVDEPKDFGGSDTGPTPTELFVGSLAACVAHCAERYLHRCQLPAGVTVTVRYDFGLQPAHLSTVVMEIAAPGLPEGLRDSFMAAVGHCPVLNTLYRPPEVTFQVLTTGQEAVCHRN
ncbi:OsmC family protein [Microtetraspora sp. NBRC 16547]|uniref:OsmC family protein n=1 Tax=Microtetraspora sp. NBRC 16547 TaxID=3030993 RepID=UPI0024A4C267|nr:OsmC family protein [Microtetraspora sp. NBRC 16547]GLW98491.1 osmotically inducible protein C [Microtetraspora sp. NBRC 16547]